MLVALVTDLDALEFLDKEDLIKIVKGLMGQGITLSFHGKRTAAQIMRRVRPRQTRTVPRLCVGSPENQARNLLIEGENLQAMATLYKYRDQFDLIVADPPYNTGQYFRYNDKWDEDPNDPDLGTLITLEDGSRHTKWMKVILPRLEMMKAMLKTQGVIAMCIDDNELFHLGMMMDEVFGEENRIAIINWQKSYSPKNDSRHVSSATEYVLVYAKDKSQARTGLTERTDEMNSSYRNPDKDPDGDWYAGDATSKDRRDHDRYGIQSPFSGAIYYPGGRSWQLPKKKLKEVLELWGSNYVEKDIKDGRAKALIIENSTTPIISTERAKNLDNDPCVPLKTLIDDPILVSAKEKAEIIRDKHINPVLVFLANGYGTPRLKRHLKYVKQGKVPLTYWADEDYDAPIELESQSWDHEESGHSQTGVKELDAIVGKGHNFDTVKPLKLIMKIIQIWCPPNGLVLDPYAGSGTTGHAVLELNRQTGSDRRFILIEQGNRENGDKYARTLTHERLRRVITGERPGKNGAVIVSAEPIDSGFSFQQLMSRIDAKTVLSMRRDELIDVVISSHWEQGRRSSPNIIRLDVKKYSYLVGHNGQGQGYFIIWDGEKNVGQVDRQTFKIISAEAKKAGLKPPFHVYARYELLQSPNVYFYKIPDKILAHLGLNENADRFNNGEAEARD